MPRIWKEKNTEGTHKKKKKRDYKYVHRSLEKVLEEGAPDSGDIQVLGKWSFKVFIMYYNARQYVFKGTSLKLKVKIILYSVVFY